MKGVISVAYSRNQSAPMSKEICGVPWVKVGFFPTFESGINKRPEITIIPATIS